ncbi:MAG: aminotransferase class I/II-fold pyridoxal phosphate-dependent enzyme [Bacteroidota bacterium]
MTTPEEIGILKNSIEVLEMGLLKLEHAQDVDPMLTENILLEVANKMTNNYPYHHPLYAGQMLKPPHPVARLAYTLAMQINPNNHALDGSRASSPMEKEAVQQLAHMFGYERHIGHLTGGGTMANLEALWIADQIHPGKVVVASEHSHYTHERISSVLKIPFRKVKADKWGRMDIADLKQQLERDTNIGTVVVTLGTPGTGSVDPLEDIIKLQQEFDFRIHVDAAYGGYFRLASNLQKKVSRRFAAISKVDSIVIDPHKHGLQPYGCGCILFKDPSVGQFYNHDSPYTYFTSDELHLGEISLECSRAGAAAVALWATLKHFPLVKNGGMAEGMNRCHAAAISLFQKIENDPGFITLFQPETDIVVWAATGTSLSEISRKNQQLFDYCARQDLHLALFNYPAYLLPDHWEEIAKDQDYVTCLRSCLMKWEHIDWVDRIWEIIRNSIITTTD